MFDWRFLRGVAVVVAVLAVILGVTVTFIRVDAGPTAHALAAIRLI